MKKKVLYIIVSIIIIFAVFITEESLRLHLNNNATPILVIDKTKCNREDVLCFSNNKYTENYWSIGFKVEYDYIPEENNEDNLKTKLVKKEFYLFNNIKVWTATNN